MKNTFYKLLLITITLSALPVQAAETDPGKLLSDAGANSGLQEQEIEVVIGNIIYALLGFLGTIFLVLIIYAGFTWMTAGGNEEKITKAQKIIRNSIIGLAIVILSYALTFYILEIIAGGVGAGGA